MGEAVRDTVLQVLCIQSAVGAGLILLMMALRKLFREKVPARLIYALWLAVAVRMLLPVQLPNPVVLVVGHVPYALETRIVQAADAAASYPAESGPSASVPAFEQQAAAVAAEESALMKAEAPKAASREVQRIPDPRLTASDLLLGLWLAGAAFMAAYTVIVNRYWGKSVMDGAKALDTDAPIPVLLANVCSPCLVGVFRPRILINKAGEKPENLPFVLRHELSHYRGLDHVWNLLSKILLALFWFHPLVWAAEALRKRDCERACDERVTRALDQGEASAYARTLIALVSPEKVRFAPATATMATTLTDMKRRIAWVLVRKQVRRWACALFAGLILLTAAASFATGERPVREITLPEEFKAQPSYYPTDSGLWLGLNGRLYKQSEGDTFTEVASASPGQIAADVSAVYMLDHETNEIVKLDHMGGKIKAWALPKELSPFKLEIAGDKLAILSGLPMDLSIGRYPAEGTVYLLDQQTGDLAEMKLGNVMDISADGTGNLVVLHTPVTSTQEALVTRLNPNSLSTVAIATTDFQALCIAAEPGACYILTWDSLQKFNEQTTVFTTINLPMKAPGERLREIRVAGGSMYAWDFRDSRLLSVDVSENRDQGKTVLTILNRGYADEAFDSAKEAFLKHHPQVQFRDITMGPEQYTTSLMAGDTWIDILFEFDGLIVDLGRAGALVSLSDEPSVMEGLSKAEWLPFEKHYSHNGKLYGVPGYVMYDLWTLDASLARQTGFVMPKVPYTWHDLYEAASAAGLGQSGKPALMHDLTWNPALIYNYTMAKVDWEGTLNYDTPAFREDMEAFKQMVKENMVVLRDEAENYPTTGPLLQRFADISEQAVLPPAVDGREGVIIQSYGFCVNARSQNRALALEFLAEYVQPEHQYKNNYGSVAPDTMLLLDEDQYDRTWYDNPRFEEQRYTQYQKELRLYLKDKWVAWSIDMHPVRILENTNTIKRYMNGSITLDEFIKIIQDRADMMQYE